MTLTSSKSLEQKLQRHLNHPRAAIVAGKLDEAGLMPAERALLEYVELITRPAYRSTPNDVEILRVAGWKEEQISEAVYITALFAFFNRVADAFGVPSQDYLTTGKLTPLSFDAFRQHLRHERDVRELAHRCRAFEKLQAPSPEDFPHLLPSETRRA